MAGDAIGQLGQHDRIILIPRSVAIQAPAHIHRLGLGDGHLADFSMAVLTVQTRRDVRPVTVVDEVWQDCHGGPVDRLVVLDGLQQLVDLRRPFLDLLVAAIALGNGWQSRGRTA